MADPVDEFGVAIGYPEVFSEDEQTPRTARGDVRSRKNLQEVSDKHATYLTQFMEGRGYKHLGTEKSGLSEAQYLKFEGPKSLLRLEGREGKANRKRIRQGGSPNIEVIRVSGHKGYGSDRGVKPTFEWSIRKEDNEQQLNSMLLRKYKSLPADEPRPTDQPGPEEPTTPPGWSPYETPAGNLARNVPAVLEGVPLISEILRLWYDERLPEQRPEETGRGRWLQTRQGKGQILRKILKGVGLTNLPLRILDSVERYYNLLSPGQQEGLGEFLQTFAEHAGPTVIPPKVWEKIVGTVAKPQQGIASLGEAMGISEDDLPVIDPRTTGQPGPEGGIASLPVIDITTRDGRAEFNQRRVSAFAKLASDQVGNPEVAMTRAQDALGGGVVNYVIEHVGDLTNRMAAKYGEFSEGLGYDVGPKVQRSLRGLRSKYGFAREHAENMAGNADYMGISLEEHTAEVNAALKEYADAHRNLEVFNEPQEWARDAAVALGEQNWAEAERLLTKLDTLMQDENAYRKAVGTYRGQFIDQRGADYDLRSGDQPGPEGGIASLPVSGDQPGPVGEDFLHNDLNDMELLAGYVNTGFSDSKFSSVGKNEIINRFQNNPYLREKSINALNEINAINPDTNTVTVYRAIITRAGKEIFPETRTSASVSIDGLIRNVNDFTKQSYIEGMTATSKLGMYDNLFIAKYEVPTENIIGYLPAFKNDITKKVNEVLNDKGFGQENIRGFEKIKNQANHAKNLIGEQDEILVNVSDVEMQVMKDLEGVNRPIAQIGGLGRLIQKIATGEIKTLDDFNANISPNQTLLEDIFVENAVELEQKERQRFLDYYKKYFGKSGNMSKGGFIDKPLYESARLIG